MSTRSGAESNGDLESKTERLKWHTALLLFAAGALTATTTLGAVVYGWLGPLLNSPGAEIRTPSSVTVPMSFDLSGTFKDVPVDELLWVANRAHSNNRWQPQDKPCAKLNDGEFSCGKVFLGRQDESDKGRAFDIVIVRADPSAVNEFLRYDKEDVDRDRGIYPGLQMLPAGAQILARETVTRE